MGKTVSLVHRNGTVITMELENPGPEMRVPIMNGLTLEAVAIDAAPPPMEWDSYRLGHVGPHGIHYYYRIRD